MTHASLFSGVGGFDLAAEWAGWTNMFNCEIDAFCRRARFPALGLPDRFDAEEREVADRCAVQPARDARRTLPAEAWENFPTHPPPPSWRMQSIKAYGNAIVPQVFYQIAETINEYERL